MIYIALGKQQVLAVGDSSGTLHILEVPWSLSHSSSNEVCTCTRAQFLHDEEWEHEEP